MCRYHCLLTLLLCASMFSVSQVASGQNSSLFQRDLPVGKGPPPTLDNSSWLLTPALPPREIRVHDIISIRVDEAARMLSEGDVERRKNLLYNGVLLDWIRLTNGLDLKKAPQPDGDPRIKAQLDQLYRANSELETRESLVFNIAAHVADIRPNGNLVLEAHRQIRNNKEVWEYSLTGICRKEDLGPGNVVLSRDIADLQIHKREMGHVRDGYRRGWFLYILDQISPF
jgi:flagellar L-ring protein precursor FlgH